MSLRAASANQRFGAGRMIGIFALPRVQKSPGAATARTTGGRIPTGFLLKILI
jgi:hypothetical protein